MGEGVGCVLNHCKQPQGLGTWAYIAGLNAPQPVCEDHWHALREVTVRHAAGAIRAAAPAQTTGRTSGDE